MNASSLTSGSAWSAIWRVTWPMLVVMLLNFIVGITDVYVAGLISPEIQAAVGFVAQLYFFLIIIANAISIGCVALVAKAVGGGERQLALETGRQALIFGVAVALALMLLGVWSRNFVVELAGLPSAVRPVTEIFILYYALALGPNYLLIILNAVFRASGEVCKPVAIMAVVTFVNFGGVFTLTFGFGPIVGHGYAGIAQATAISMFAGLFCGLRFLILPAWRPILVGSWRLKPRLLGEIFRLGWPAGLQQIAWSAGTLILYALLARLDDSVTALAAITAGGRIESIIFLPGFALNMAAAILVGQNLGAGQTARAVRLSRRVATVGVVLLSLIAALVFACAGQLARFMTADAGVQAQVVNYLRINMLSEPFMALSLVLGGSLQGGGDTRGNMWVIVFCMWLVRLPLAGLLAFGLKLDAAGIWWAMTISMIIQGLLMSWRFRLASWRRAETPALG